MAPAKAQAATIHAHEWEVAMAGGGPTEAELAALAQALRDNPPTGRRY